MLCSKARRPYSYSTFIRRVTENASDQTRRQQKQRKKLSKRKWQHLKINCSLKQQRQDKFFGLFLHTEVAVDQHSPIQINIFKFLFCNTRPTCHLALSSVPPFQHNSSMAIWQVGGWNSGMTFVFGCWNIWDFCEQTNRGSHSVVHSLVALATAILAALFQQL